LTASELAADAGRDAVGDRAGGDIAGDDGPGADQGMLADADPAEDDRPGPDAGAVAEERGDEVGGAVGVAPDHLAVIDRGTPAPRKTRSSRMQELVRWLPGEHRTHAPIWVARSTVRLWPSW
jgi:hypothetical protein